MSIDSRNLHFSSFLVFDMEEGAYQKRQKAESDKTSLELGIKKLKSRTTEMAQEPQLTHQPRFHLARPQPLTVERNSKKRERGVMEQSISRDLRAVKEKLSGFSLPIFFLLPIHFQTQKNSSLIQKLRHQFKSLFLCRPDEVLG